MNRSCHPIRFLPSGMCLHSGHENKSYILRKKQQVHGAAHVTNSAAGWQNLLWMVLSTSSVGDQNIFPCLVWISSTCCRKQMTAWANFLRQCLLLALCFWDFKSNQNFKFQSGWCTYLTFLGSRNC